MLACLLGVAPLAGWAVQGAGPAVAEAGFSLLLYGAILLAALGLGVVARRVEPGSPGLGRIVPVDRRSRPPGQGRSGRNVGYGLTTGFAAFALAIGYCALAGTLGRGAGAGRSALSLGLLTVTWQVWAEEVMFRGYVQPLLVRGVGPVGAVALTALSFAALHSVFGGVAPTMLANMLLGGVLFGLLALDGGVAAAFGAHFAWNAVEQIGVGLDPNPGAGAFGALIDLDLSGAAAWGGSATGLNGSIAMAIALLATILIVLWRRGRA